MVALEFRNAELEGSSELAAQEWQGLLWVQAEFSAYIPEGRLLSQPHWCILELAVHLAAWSRAASPDGPAFDYTSMDEEQEGLLWFRPVGSGMWLIGSAWQELENQQPVRFAALEQGVQSYIQRVLAESRPLLTEELAGRFRGQCA